MWIIVSVAAARLVFWTHRPREGESSATSCHVAVYDGEEKKIKIQPWLCESPAGVTRRPPGEGVSNTRDSNFFNLHVLLPKICKWNGDSSDTSHMRNISFARHNLRKRLSLSVSQGEATAD